MRHWMFLLATGLLLTGCGWVKPLNADARQCYDYGPDRRFNCLMQLAKERADVSFCNYIISEGFRVTCMKSVALQECDVSVCEAIRPTWKQPSCFDAVEKHKVRGRCD